jgi:hypothetical protein
MKARIDLLSYSLELIRQENNDLINELIVFINEKIEKLSLIDKTLFEIEPDTRKEYNFRKGLLQINAKKVKTACQCLEILKANYSADVEIK